MKPAEKRLIKLHARLPAERWADVASRPGDVEAARRLAASVMADIGRRKSWAAAWWLATRAAYGVTLKRSGHYVEESDYLAAALTGGALSPADMAGLQRLYTFAHAGCSAVMGWDEDSGRMLHFRCLDWPSAPAIAQASRLYEMVDETRRTLYRSAGILGLVGCLSAAKPGFSAAINFAPWTGPSLSPRTDPTFLLRRLMESPAATYEAARAMIESWRPSAPVFITLCGAQKGQACILAFGAAWNRRQACHVTEIGDDPWLVQTNHHDPAGPFAAHKREAAPADTSRWEDYTLLETSVARKRQIEEGLSRAPSGAGLERTLRRVFQEPPVWNSQTAQWVAMDPACGEIRLEAVFRG